MRYVDYCINTFCTCTHLPAHTEFKGMNYTGFTLFLHESGLYREQGQEIWDLMSEERKQEYSARAVEINAVRRKEWPRNAANKSTRLHIVFCSLSCLTFYNCNMSTCKRGTLCFQETQLSIDNYRFTGPFGSVLGM